MVAAIFAADTHLSEITWASRSELRGDSFFGFSQACDLAIEHGVPLCLAGDCWELMHDPHPSAQVIRFVREQLDRLQAAGCPCYYVNGQHDKLSNPYWFAAIHRHPEHVGGKTFKLGDQTWFGVDFFERHQSAEVYAEIPRDVDGIMIHQRWAEFAGSKHFASESLAMLPPVKGVVSGDMHKLIINEEIGRWAVSPGATHMRSVAEPETHYVIKYDPQSGTEPFVPYQLQSRPVIRVEITDEPAWLEAIPDLVQRVEQVNRECFERTGNVDISRPLLVISDVVACGAGELVLEHTDLAHVVVKLSKQSASADDDLREIVSHDEDLTELTMRIADRRGMSDAGRYLLGALIDGKDLRVEVMRLGASVAKES